MAPFLNCLVVLTAVRHMVVVRGRSRHTFGFAPLDHFDLPLLELQALMTSDELRLDPVDTSDFLYWANVSVNVNNDTDTACQRLIDAAARAIFTHASFEIVHSSHQLANVAILAKAAGCELSFSLTQVVDMGNPNLSNADRIAILNHAGVVVDSKRVAMPSHSVLIRQDNGRVHIGRRTATGPAAGLGAPGKAQRRNYKGVLGTFALKNRLRFDLTNTAMETEIAFYMANLARVSKGSRILDPCCGSASLLLIAAACGAEEIVGVDSNSTAFWGASEEFQRHALPVPVLTHGDVLEPHMTNALFISQYYDAIICDPPYNIGAPVLVDGRDDRPARYDQEHLNKPSSVSPLVDGRDDRPARYDQEHLNKPSSVSPLDLTAAVLEIAHRTLVIGGRLVFFVPVRGDEANLSLEEAMLRRGWDEDSSTLEIVHGRLQRFSATFSRWLVCMERNT